MFPEIICANNLVLVATFFVFKKLLEKLLVLSSLSLRRYLQGASKLYAVGCRLVHYVNVGFWYECWDLYALSIFERFTGDCHVAARYFFVLSLR